MTALSLVRASAFALFLAVAAPAVDAATSFRIDQLFSSLDGATQYIVLRESAGLDGEQAIGGLTLRSTVAGTTRVYTIPRDLFYSTTAGKTVVIGTTSSLPVCCTQFSVVAENGMAEPYWLASGMGGDYFGLPERFLSIDGGTVELVGIDAVTYGPLPTSGHHALDRTGKVVDAVVRPFWAASFPYPIPTRSAPAYAVSVPAREYFHAGLDRYLLTANAQDIEAIEQGIAAGWTLVGQPFNVFTTTGTPMGGPAGSAQDFGTVPVCRYYLPPPLDTHFLSASPAECAAIDTMPGAVLESDAAFYVYLPDPATGSCGYRNAIYRLWNGRADANHRWTSNPGVRAALIATGWVPEGAGPLGAVFCGEFYDWF